MKYGAVGLLVMLCATPALAASYSVGVSAAGPGKVSQTSFTGFDGSLGTLTGVEFNLSGTTTYQVTLGNNGGSVPPSGTVDYNVSNGTFLYINAVGTQPYLPQTGSGTAALTFGVIEAITSGQNAITQITNATILANFVNADLSGYFAVDDPFSASFSVNGGPSSGPFGASFSIQSKSITGSVTYTYTAFGGAVPEPASWLLMIAGLGTAGIALRRERRRPVLAGGRC